MAVWTSFLAISLTDSSEEKSDDELDSPPSPKSSSLCSPILLSSLRCSSGSLSSLNKVLPEVTIAAFTIFWATAARLSLFIDAVADETESSHSLFVSTRDALGSFSFESGDASLVTGSPNALSKIFLAISPTSSIAPTSSLAIEECSDTLSPPNSSDALVPSTLKLASSESPTLSFLSTSIFAAFSGLVNSVLFPSEKLICLPLLLSMPSDDPIAFSKILRVISPISSSCEEKFDVDEISPTELSSLIFSDRFCGISLLTSLFFSGKALSASVPAPVASIA